MSTESNTVVVNHSICTDDSNISQISSDVVNVNVIDLNLVKRAIVKQEQHPSILKIKEVFESQNKLSFV